MLAMTANAVIPAMTTGVKSLDLITLIEVSLDIQDVGSEVLGVDRYRYYSERPSVICSLPKPGYMNLGVLTTNQAYI